jgi:hypothetical protein
VVFIESESLFLAPVQPFIRLIFSKWLYEPSLISFAIAYRLWVILASALECLQTDKSLSRFPQNWWCLVVFGVHVRLTESLKNHRRYLLEPMGSRPAWLRHFRGSYFLTKKSSLTSWFIEFQKLTQIHGFACFFTFAFAGANGSASMHHSLRIDPFKISY